MTTVLLQIELLDDVAITESNATIDAHESLTYIPGQCLLGALARSGYHDHGLPDGEWRIFHSGEVRFGCALPLIGGEPAWPSPLSWHRPKGLDVVDKKTGVVSASVVNLAAANARAPDTQYAQVRDLYVNASGQMGASERARTMRTAIGAEGRARDGYLFTVSALTRGQTFLAELASDDDAALETVQRALLALGTIRLGRSRSAEFGGAAIRASALSDASPRRRAYHATSSALVWCLSDVCFRDADTGQPTFAPSPAQLGLPANWRFATEGSFLRTRRYSPFNSHRRRPDLDRQVIVAGSVLRFESADGSTLAPEAWKRAADACARNIGEHRAEGMGRVVFEPEILQNAGHRFTSNAPSPAPAPPTATRPADALVSWLEGQHADRLARDIAWTRAVVLLRVLGERPRWALPASQWGEVRRLARLYRHLDGPALAGVLDEFVRATGPREGVRALHDRWGSAWRGETLAQWIVREVKAIADDAPVPAITLEILGSHAVRQQRSAGEAAR